MNILIIGRGAREHCLAWKCRQSKLVNEIFVAKGNDGIKYLATLVDIEETDVNNLLEFAKNNAISLTIVGTETPLEYGIADIFRANGLKIFAPSKEAAKIETSKDFAKQLMQRAAIPTANYATFTHYDEAISYLNKVGIPIVIKNDGLAAGKGVVVAMSMAEAIEALDSFLKNQKFGAQKVVIEEYLEGEEFTLMCLANGENCIALPLSQDHKRAYDNDLGPNTGGMGAYTPVPQITCFDDAMDKVVRPVLKQMREENMPFTGFLYAGLMQTKLGVKVIEFNARFGDPECEVLLPVLEFDIVETILNLLQTQEEKYTNSFSVSDCCVGVVLASKGYPEKPETSNIIEFPETNEVIVFHAGTKLKENTFVSNGGRVAVIVAKENTIEAAQKKVYTYIDDMNLSEHFFYRKDIAHKANK